jgi:N-acetyl-anhydromuramyl-L-alanine amidase AmpD
MAGHFAPLTLGFIMALRKRTDLIVVHVTATPPSHDIGANEVDAMHRAKGWAGIGYHFVDRRGGQIETGRGINQIGAHVEGWNSVSIGIALVGGVDERGRPQDNRTPQQTLSLRQLIQSLLKTYPNAKVCGHRDLSPDRDGDGVIEPHEHIKACPCFDAIPWAKDNRLPAAAIHGVWETRPRVQGAIDAAGIVPPAPDARQVYLQKLLQRAGYTFGPIDGLIGKRTKAAIRQYQSWTGLPVTGEFDTATVRHLRAHFEQVAA